MLSVIMNELLALNLVCIACLNHLAMLQGSGHKQSIYKVAEEFHRVRTSKLRYILFLYMENIL